MKVVHSVVCVAVLMYVGVGVSPFVRGGCVIVHFWPLLLVKADCVLLAGLYWFAFRSSEY